MTSFGSTSASSSSFAIPFLQIHLHCFRYGRKSIYQAIQKYSIKEKLPDFLYITERKKAVRGEKKKTAQLTLADKYKLQRDEFMPCSVRNLVYDIGRIIASLHLCWQTAGTLWVFSFSAAVGWVKKNLVNQEYGWSGLLCDLLVCKSTYNWTAEVNSSPVPNSLDFFKM